MLPWFLSVAQAHQAGLSTARVDPDRVSLTFARPELTDRFDAAELPAARTLLADLTLGRVAIEADGAPCQLGEATLTLVENDGVELAAPLRCPTGRTWTFHAGFLDALEDGHRVVLQAGDDPVGVLDRAAPDATFAAVLARGEVAVQLVRLGVEHIWTGYDHLLFLFGLLLVTRRLKDMLLIVTGFTVSHSITLALAALGAVSLSPAVVEPAIALSIAWVGVENLWRPGPRRRLAITFLLGFIHGFGFAGLLREIGLPRGSLVLALVCFNGGVEIGQAAVAAVALPALLWLRRWPAWERRAVPALSLVVAAAGLLWFAQRVAGG